jgi:hypothetical protein
MGTRWDSLAELPGAHEPERHQQETPGSAHLLTLERIEHPRIRIKHDSCCILRGSVMH